MNVISFSFLPACIGFAVRQSCARPRFPALKFLLNIWWDLRGRKAHPTPQLSPPPVLTIWLISSHPLALPSSLHHWVGGARSGPWGQPDQCEPLHEGRVPLLLPSATVPLPGSHTSCWPKPLARPEEMKKKEEKKEKTHKIRNCFQQVSQAEWAPGGLVSALPWRDRGEEMPLLALVGLKVGSKVLPHSSP